MACGSIISLSPEQSGGLREVSCCQEGKGRFTIKVGALPRAWPAKTPGGAPVPGNPVVNVYVFEVGRHVNDLGRRTCPA